jgi:putative tricarboxylic transport membrane protein
MRFSDSAIGTALVLFGISVLLYTQRFPAMEGGVPGPATYPNVLAGLMILAGLALIVRGIKNKERFFRVDLTTLTPYGFVNILIVLGAIVIYILFSERIGFLIMSFVLLTVLMKWLRVKWGWSLLMSGAVTLGIYLLFGKMLRVPLPWGLWGW